MATRTMWFGLVLALLLPLGCESGGGEADVTPDVVADVAADTTPDVLADVAPDIAGDSDTTPDVVPDTVADTTPDVVPDTVADTTPDVVPDTTPDVAPDTTSCTTPLTAEQLGNLAISLAPSIDMQPGQSKTLSVGVVECCVFLTPVEACVTWSISPTEGASIDAATGLLSIDAATPSGKVFTVTANVEDGTKVLTETVGVWTPQANPLWGNWTEAAQLSCADGSEHAPEQVIGELRFWAAGTAWVTWTPFETYVDYWSDYSFQVVGGEAIAGPITLTPTGGNYTPADLDTEGNFELTAEGDLILRDMWLGTPQGGTAPAACGHRFTK